MVAPVMTQFKDLKDEIRRLKNMCAKERLKAKIIQETMEKMVKPTQWREMPQAAVGN